ncbi:unannotated protein [freshwater metagenome]|uniref:Unannotated protein n=1 Tax=freshwater metagenome TaxID=449393 RepID=A0A6J7SUL6_9ZZZZ
MSSPAVIDLLGVLAYGELVAFERTAADASLAPTLADKAALAEMAAAEFAHYEQLSAHLTSLGSDPIVAMQPFVSALDQFHNTLTPRDWLEGLLKAYVGDGIANDFYREISSHMDTATATLVSEVLSDVGHADFAIERIRDAITQDPKVSGRLALWGRRLMGEMISQATLVAASRPALQELFLRPPEGEVNMTATELTAMVNRLTVGHAKRMDVLGLAS